MDMEKAFDHVFWKFIDYMLDRMGFGEKWGRRMCTCISTTSFAVMVNGSPSTFFSATRGLRQGDPLSPLLFIIAMKGLNKLIEKAKNLHLLRSIKVGNFGKQLEITHLLCADDSLMFCQLDVNSLLILRWILLCFQAVSSLKINLHKSELVELGTVVNGQTFGLDFKL